MKRHIVFPLDFDSRAYLLKEPEVHWQECVKKLHFENQAKLIEELKAELGELNFEQKLQNFKDSGQSPFSIISHHNILYIQARYAFIYGFYYPALTSACALGERVFNHLILDLRDNYRSTPIYKEIYRKRSFQDWGDTIKILTDWGVFQHPGIEPEFHKLKELRMRSIHFTPETYKNLRSDALAALSYVALIIHLQFGTAAGQKWMIEGTKGAFFIKKDAEQDPFIAKYYLPQCPLVGPYYAMYFNQEGHWLIFDWINYDNREISDEEFVKLFKDKTPEQLASTSVPVAANVHVHTIVR